MRKAEIMDRKYLGRAVLTGLVIFVISGCGTVPKKFQEEVGGIKTRVETLESRVEGVEARQSDAERAAADEAEKERRVKTNISTRSKSRKGVASTKEIQISLKNAGFYKGSIDGIKGANTKKAIREFQEANGLTVDGKVGPKTWELLSRYAEGAAGEGPKEEGAVK